MLQAAPGLYELVWGEGAAETPLRDGCVCFNLWNLQQAIKMKKLCLVMLRLTRN